MPATPHAGYCRMKQPLNDGEDHATVRQEGRPRVSCCLEEVMLSVTRKVGEQVVIGHDVIVKILEVVAGRVRLGIEAPPGSSVRRGEVTAPIPDAAVAAVAAQRREVP